MRPEVVTQILEEVVPDAARGNLILRTVTKSGCNELETVDYQNATIFRSRHKCRLPSPEGEEAATVTLKNPPCSNVER